MITRRAMLASMLASDAFFPRKGQVNVEVERPVSVSGTCFHPVARSLTGSDLFHDGK